MTSDPKKSKIRTKFRKKHQPRTRKGDLTRDYQQHGFDEEATAYNERISGKGELTRHKTIIGDHADAGSSGFKVHLHVDEEQCLAGRVLSVHGLSSVVETLDGKRFQCATRQLLKSLSTEQRHVVASGDRVLFRPVNENEGFIERIEPRHGVLSRTSRNRQHVIVTNVDQLLIVVSAAEPTLKPNLIDRFLITAEKADITAVICINKIDLVDPADLQPLIGVYGQMGYHVQLVSAETGFGIQALREILKDQETVLAGQSGVGKSTILNQVEPGLDLRVDEVSSDNQKGRHTTTAATLLPLSFGGYVVDTPGIRQLELWDVIAEEVAGFFRDLRPYINHCRFPNCTHTHENYCAVKDAVADGQLDTRRYDSYCQLATPET
jgi:ribosome biogenesis GTPase